MFTTNTARVIGRSVPVMEGAELDGARPDSDAAPDVASLLPMLRRIVFSRVGNEAAAEDLVQETLVKVLAAANRIEPGMLEPYAITTARHVIASMWRSQDTQRRNQHRVVGMDHVDAPDERLLKEEERAAVSAALEHLSEREQQTLLAHEVSGQDMRSLATELNTTAGAVAAQLNRTRARMRVEYLLALHDAEPPTDRCRPVLYAISGAIGVVSARSMPPGMSWSVSCVPSSASRFSNDGRKARTRSRFASSTMPM